MRNGKRMNIPETLVARAKQGDQTAISELYEQTYSEAYYAVKSMIRDEDALSDILQDSYLKAFTHLDSFEGNDRFIPWMRQIAANTARDWLKKKRPMLFSELETEDGGDPIEERFAGESLEGLPQQELDEAETRRLLQEIIGELPEDQRAAIGMYYYEEMSVKEIAAAMEASENAVKSRLLYGRRKIESKVRDLEKKGTKLYGLAPIPFLLWLLRAEKACAAELPDEVLLQSILRELPAGTSNAAVTGTASKAAAGAAKSLGTAKIALIAVAAAAVIGAGAFGISRMSRQSAIISPDEILPVPASSAIEEPEPQAGETPSEETPDDPLEIYREVIENAASYDYDTGFGNPTGIYRYALVFLKEEDTIPALLLSQETDDYMEHVRVFQYDSAAKEILQPAETLLTGAASAGGYRGGLSLGENKTGLQLTTVSAGTGAMDVYRITVEGDVLKAASVWSGRIDLPADGLAFEEIEWVEITGSTDPEHTNGQTDASGADALPEDGDRLVLTGTVCTMNYDEAVELQGYPDYNAADKEQTWVIVRLDSPQILKGSQDVSTWEKEYSVVLVWTRRSSGSESGENTLSDYIGEHIVFSAGSFSKASDTSVPIGIPWAHDIRVLRTGD